METETPVPFASELRNLAHDRLFKRTLELFLYYEKKMSIEAISEFTTRSISTIYRTIQNWKSFGLIEEKSGRGRTPSYSKREKQKVMKKQLTGRYKTSVIIAQEMKAEGSHMTYGQTKCLIQDNFITFEAKRSLVISPQNKQKRLDWIETHSLWRKSKWASVWYPF